MYVPRLDWVAGHAESAAFIGGGHEPEQQLGAGVIERGEPHFVDYADIGIAGRLRYSGAGLRPTASEVMSAIQFSQSMSSSGSGSGPASPPPVSGTLSAAQASAAEQVVRAFWTALSSNLAQAVERTVVPSRRTCVAGFLQGSKVQVQDLVTADHGAKPAGNGKATVWFSVNATVQTGRQTIPMAPSGAPGTNWLLATETGNVCTPIPSTGG